MSAQDAEPRDETSNDTDRSRLEIERFRSALWRATPRIFVTQAIVAANVIVFLAMLATGAGIMNPSSEAMLKWGANFGPMTAGGEWWRLVSAFFLHFGLMHLAFNMWALFDAGRLVERLYGNGPFLLLYLFAGLTGSFGSLLWNPDGVVSAGASGAVFGVYGALLAYLLAQRHSIPAAVIKGLQGSTIAFIGYTLVIGLSASGIDNAAHLGGLAGGMGLGFVLARPLAWEIRQRMFARRLALVLVSSLAILALLWALVPPPKYDIRQEQLAQAEVKWFAAEEDAILNNWKQTIDLRRTGAIDDLAMAERVERLAVAKWDGAYMRLAQVKLAEASPSSERYKLLLRYIELRRDSAKAFAEAAKTQNWARLQEFRALQMEVEKVMEQMKQKSAKTK